MLHDFLVTHRETLIERCRLKVTERVISAPNSADLHYGIPLFLEQLTRTLQLEQTSQPESGLHVSGPADGGPVPSEIGASAGQHGRELLQQGFTVDQVVHDYGDLCQAITNLASEKGVSIQTNEFRTLNRCLDNAIADAVSEFSNRRELAIMERGAQAFNQQLGLLAHELRNHINTAKLAVSVIKSGNVGLSGATAGILDRSLIGLSHLIDRSLATVRVTAGLPNRHELVSLSELILEVEMSASLEAQARGCRLVVGKVDAGLAVDADKEMLLSAIGNLLQNAFKFTQHSTAVTLSAYAEGERILIDVQDHCGGLPGGDPEEMFTPFTQRSANRSGVGLGLAICRRSVEANDGILTVRDVPGSGCVFSIDLPRYAIT